jgi:hypothetical protein
MQRFFVRALCVSFLAVSIISCNKNEKAPANGAAIPAVDTTVKAEPVAIRDTNHHLYFRPAAGTTARYHVIDRMDASLSDQPPTGGAVKHSSTSTTEYYLRETVKMLNKDSTTELTMRIDTVNLDETQDTQKVHYSSSNPQDRASDKFREFNLLIGKDFTIKTNKFGDLIDVPDVSAIANGLMLTVPDSVRKDPRVKQMATRQAGQIVVSYVTQVLGHSPMHPLVQDTTWHNSVETNLPVTEGLTSPVTLTATETVKGLEKRNDKVLAVLEENTVATPKKMVNEEGPVKETFTNFVVNSHTLTRLEDATGLLYQMSRSEKRSFTFIVEDKEHPGQKRTVSQMGTQAVSVELLQ